MSALGQKQTLAHVGVMSALPPIADIRQGNRDVRFVPKADMEQITARSIRRRARVTTVALSGQGLWRSHG